MKRLWFAVAFLIIAAGLCVGEQCFIKNFHSEMEQKITAAQSAAEEGNTEKLKQKTDEMKMYWDKNNNLICTITNHGVPNDFGSKIKSVDADSDGVEEALAEVYGWNNVLYENQKITFANVF